MYDFSDLSDEELELIAEEGGPSLARLRTRADSAVKRGLPTADAWCDLLQATVDDICVRYGIKGGEADG